MMLLENLGKAKAGKAILFCGSGFSANCLNINSQSFGVGGPLLTELNKALDYEYSDMQVAADDYLEEFGETKLFNLLSDRFSTKEIATECLEILKFPWWRVYTTNYDNVIGDSLRKLGKSSYIANNTENPNRALKMAEGNTLVAHLHGAMQKWEPDNFRKSCVLGRDSYFNISQNREWAGRLREDLGEAKYVVFVGFSNSDFYLAEEIRDTTSLKSKSIFINFEGSRNNKELIGRQKKFGDVSFIGCEGLARITVEALAQEDLAEPEVSSFQRVQTISPSQETPSLEDQYTLFVNGDLKLEHVSRDILNGTNGYRGERTAIGDLLSGGPLPDITVLFGGISCGKTQIITELAQRLNSAGADVFSLKRQYSDTQNEIDALCEFYDSPIFICDDFQKSPNVIRWIASNVAQGKCKLIFAGRTHSTSSLDLEGAFPSEKSDTIRYIEVERIDFEEERRLLNVMNRVAEQRLTDTAVRNQNNRLATLLLQIFKSQSVKDKFEAEIEILTARDENARDLIVLSLYLSFVGLGTSVSTLSELFDRDVEEVLRSANKESTILRKTNDNQVVVFPGITAKLALNTVISDEVTVNNLIRAVQRIAPDAFYSSNIRSMLGSLCRYHFIKQVVDSDTEIERFYNTVSTELYLSSNPVFWLQVSIHFSGIADLITAKRFLDRGYNEASLLDAKTGKIFDRYQLDDQWVRLALRDPSQCSPQHLRNIGQRISKLLINHGNSASIYHTIERIDDFVEKAISTKPEIEILTLQKILKKIASDMARRKNDLSRNVKDQFDKAEAALIRCYQRTQKK